MVMLSSEGLYLSRERLIRLKQELQPFQYVEDGEDGVRVLVIRSPGSYPDIVNDLEEMLYRLPDGVCDDVDHAVLLGDLEVIDVPLSMIETLLLRRTEEDEAVAVELRKRMPNTFSIELFEMDTDSKQYRRMGIRIPGPVAQLDPPHEFIPRLAGADLDRYADIVYLVADDGYRRFWGYDFYRFLSGEKGGEAGFVSHQPEMPGAAVRNSEVDGVHFEARAASGLSAVHVDAGKRASPAQGPFLGTLGGDDSVQKSGLQGNECEDAVIGERPITVSSEVDESPYLSKGDTGDADHGGTRAEAVRRSSGIPYPNRKSALAEIAQVLLPDESTAGTGKKAARNLPEMLMGPPLDSPSMRSSAVGSGGGPEDRLYPPEPPLNREEAIHNIVGILVGHGLEIAHGLHKEWADTILIHPSSGRRVALLYLPVLSSDQVGDIVRGMEHSGDITVAVVVGGRISPEARLSAVGEPLFLVEYGELSRRLGGIGRWLE